MTLTERALSLRAAICTQALGVNAAERVASDVAVTLNQWLLNGQALKTWIE